MKITKLEGNMTSRQRVINTFNYEKVDRVPINYATNLEVHKRLASALGIKNGDYELVLQALGVDFRDANAAYNGPLLFPEREGLMVDPAYGTYARYVEHDGGGYWEHCDFPLQDADPEIIANYPCVSPDDFDYDAALERINSLDNYALHVGNGGFADIINSLGRLMGMEDALVNLAIEDEATLCHVDQRVNMQLGNLERLLDKAKGRIDFVWMGEDLGTQIAPMVSTNFYDNILRPRHQKFIDLAKSYNLPTMIHTCGSSSWVYERLIEMGMNAVDTLQPEAVNMSPQYLKEQFGGRLSFHGCISTAGVLATGSVDDIRKQVIDTLDVFKQDGGYMLAPTHCIQNNTPIENIIAMYQAAHDFGQC